MVLLFVGHIHHNVCGCSDVCNTCGNVTAVGGGLEGPAFIMVFCIVAIIVFLIIGNWYLGKL